METIQQLGLVHLHGVLGGKNASAVACWRGRLLVVSDELAKPERQNVLQIFAGTGNDYNSVADAVLDATSPAPAEMDLEGLALDGDTLYLLGSHSWRRKVSDKQSRAF